MDRNQIQFEKQSSVAQYAKGTELQVAEQAILDRVRRMLPDMDMLDLGVGTGRTTPHFAPLARSYLGVDYSEPMIRYCREQMPQYRFRVGDARSLGFASPDSYDLIFFSYNGIDYMDAGARRQTLLSIERILRPGGLFIFSSHNANWLPRVVENFRFRLKSTVRETLGSLRKALVFAAHNRTLRFPLPCPEGFITDGFSSFRALTTYYIRPDLQVAALRKLGMTNVECIGSDRRDFLSETDPTIPSLVSPWVYFVCRKPGGTIALPLATYP